MEVPFGFHTVELNKTEWNVPNRYQDLSAIGGGAFGQVWLVYSFIESCLQMCFEGKWLQNRLRADEK